VLLFCEVICFIIVFQAVAYYEKAASLGHVAAGYNLGVYYAQGRGGLPKDPSRARQLFLKAADHGLLQAKAAITAEDPVPSTHHHHHLPLAIGT